MLQKQHQGYGSRGGFQTLAQNVPQNKSEESEWSLCAFPVEVICQIQAWTDKVTLTDQSSYWLWWGHLGCIMYLELICQNPFLRRKVH